jgi:hypothetical protein
MNEVGGTQHIWGSGEMHTGFWGETCENETTWKTRHRWQDNIKTNLQEVGCGGVEWIELAQDRDKLEALVNVVTNLRVP